MYPCVEINYQNILENYQIVKQRCLSNNVNCSLVVKILANNYEMVSKLVNDGVDAICDSRILNLKSYKDLNVTKWLIRIPMISEAKDVVKYADISLNSELSVIKKLNEEAKKINVKHKIILMYELGDLREGCFYEELSNIVEETLKLSNIEIYGIGTNLSCYGEIIPTLKNMQELADVSLKLEKKFNIKLKVISGGNSSSYKMIENRTLPEKINNLRLGELVFLGTNPIYGETVSYLNHNNFILKTEIVELKIKPSIPYGEKGVANSFGQETKIIDRGLRKRAIVALGRQDVIIDGMTPVDKNITILDGSSDHIILDVTDSNYKVGDIVEFNLNYAATLMLMNSDYVYKKII